MQTLPKTIVISGFALVAAFVIMELAHGKGLLFITGTKIVDITLIALYALVVANAAISTFFAARMSTNYRRMWKLLTVGMLLWLVGIIVLLAYVMMPTYPHIPSPSLADVFAIAYLPIMLGVVLSVAKLRRPLDTRKKQFIANISMAIMAMFLLCFEFVLLPLWHANSHESLSNRMFAIAYPMLDWIIFSVLLFASHRLKEDQINGWIVLLLSAFGLSVTSNMPTIITGIALNKIEVLLLVLTAYLISLSAVDEVHGSLIGIKERKSKKAHKNQLAHTIDESNLDTYIVPFASAVVIPAVWLHHSNSGLIGGDILIFAISMAILVIAIQRNHRLAIDNAKLFATSMRDRLTGLSNHRYYQESLCRLIAKAKRTKKPLSLLLIDVDDFSKVNNKYGHAYGDAVLMLIGKTILANASEENETCRLSGDEFAFLMPNTSQAEALIRAEVIKKQIYRKMNETLEKGSITVSMGLSTYPSVADDKIRLQNTAEGALYWCKLHGKDSILLYDSAVVESLSPEDRAKKAEEVALVDLVTSLALAVDARDSYTRLHSKGVSVLSKRLAIRLGLSIQQASRIEIAGLLHDVGKIGISDEILNKPGRLTEEEMLTIKNHSIISAQIIDSTSLKDIVPAIRYHHERWDGNGYPDGLKNDDIPLEARIIALADTFDAMTTDRPYRKALPIADAVNEIKRCAGTQFDPELAAEFVLVIEELVLEEENADLQKTIIKVG
ncbi:MAG: diguanylate cyclase [Actinomycetota bacterium]|nr:diguanylate cyclase [Actinomycetota bacterium]